MDKTHHADDETLEYIASLEQKNAGLMEALREFYEAQCSYQTLRYTSVGERVHEARDRLTDAEETARHILSEAQ